MSEAWKLRSHVDGGAAALAVKAAHGHVIGVLKDILAQREVPTAAYAGNIEVIRAGIAKVGKIRGLHLVTGVGIGLRWR